MFNTIDYALANKAWDDAYKSMVEFGSVGRNLLVNSNQTWGENASREFVRTLDLEPIIAKYGLIEYTISFEIKSKSITNRDVIQAYVQNGSGYRHYFSSNVKVTTEFNRMSITVIPKFAMEHEKNSFLAFYGTYDTGNIPVVRDIKVELGRKATSYILAPEDAGLHPFVADLSDIHYQSESNKEDMEKLRSAVISMGGLV